MPRYRSVRYLARLLGVSRQTARRYCQQKLVRAVKSLGGGVWLIANEECERLRLCGVPAGSVDAPAAPPVLERLRRLGIG